VAQREGRGIALLFHDRGTRRGWVVSSTPWPHFTPGKDPVPVLQQAGWAPGLVWTGGNSRPHRDSIPVRLARCQSLYRLSYPAHTSLRYLWVLFLMCDGSLPAEDTLFCWLINLVVVTHGELCKDWRAGSQSAKSQGALREITECLSEEQAVDELISPPLRFICISNIVNSLVTSNWQVLNENGLLEEHCNGRFRYGWILSGSYANRFLKI